MPFPYKDLREFLSDLEAKGDLKRIKASVSYKWELAAVHRVLAKVSGPAVLLENVTGLNVKVPMLTWVWGEYRRAAMAVGAKDRDEGIQRIVDALQSKWIEPVIVDDGPCKEVIIKEDEVDLRKQIPKVYGVEPERQAYITQGVTISRDPETGIRNGGVYRYGLLDTKPDGEPYSVEEQKKEMSGWIVPGINHAGIHYIKMGGKPLEIAIAVGTDPTIFVVGCMPIPFGQDELALAGAIRDKPVELVKCETVNLEVPTTAEWVIEAEVLPGFPEEFHYDGPHAEFHGHHGPRPNELPKVRVKCITHRKNPVWPMVVELSQPPQYEHAVVMNMVHTANLYRVRDLVPFVSKIAMPIPPGSSNNGIAVVQIERKPYPFFAHHVMRALWGTREGQQLKYIIVVDEDIDPYDWDQILYALWTRVQPGESDVFIVKDRPCVHWMDPALGGEVTLVGSQMGIDATVKFPERLEKPPLKADPSKETVESVYMRLRKELDLP